MVLPGVIFDDVEFWACGYLRGALNARSEDYAVNVFVSNSMPANATTGEPERRDRMVIVRRDGGETSDYVIDRPRLGVDCWATTTQDVIDLARLVSALLAAAPGDANVKFVRVTGGPTRIADPSRQPRAYLTAELATVGVDLDT